MTCNESVFGFMKDYIEPLLQEITPIGIGITFTLVSALPFHDLPFFRKSGTSRTRLGQPNPFRQKHSNIRPAHLLQRDPSHQHQGGNSCQY